ncbi:MAG: hypothetical protein EBZ60_06315 [Betaproteobacteria bacterium]|nr:hypothetical protein [Betaproteobacteria bacterium]
MFSLLTFPRFLRGVALMLSVLTACSAHALQLGQPIVHSRLGEPLKLDVQISDLSAQEAQEFQASLATETVYQAAKINRVAGLDNVRVILTKRSEGLYVMQIVGADPVADTYVDLLMEFRWASGRAYRNIGFPLSNTATYAQKSTAPAEVLANSPASDTAANKPPRSAPLPKDLPAQDTNSKSYQDKLARAGNHQSGDTIEVLKGDTASELIMAHPTGDVSLDQLLITMLRNNPKAFVDNNVNRLKAGALVTLPTIDEARTVNRQEARQSIRLQAADFDAYRALLAGRAPTTQLADTQARQSSGGLKAQVKNNAQAPADQLTLTKPGATDADKVSKELESADSAKRNDEVSKNVSELGEISKAAAKMQDGLPTSMPSLSAHSQQAMVWVKRNAFELIAGLALLAALWVSYSIWRQRQRAAAADQPAHGDLRDPQAGLPTELNLDFDLNLPHHPTPSPAASSLPPLSTPPARQHSPVFEPKDMAEDPFRVRLDLADELWKLGQKQTGRALAQEVADQTHGETRELALRWLNERS